MKHILLKHAFVYKKRTQVKLPSEYVYDHARGAWVKPGDATLLVQQASFPAIATKKHDIETGEDQKGQ